MLGKMKRAAIDSHRSLFYTLFAIFETLLVTAAVSLWTIDPRGLPVLAEAGGITFLFSLVGLSIVSWLLKRAAPRLAQLGAVSVLVAFLMCSFLPAIP